MPPSSRKRNKGKERKAKQVAKKEENERANAHRYWRSFCSTITECNHGHPLVISDNHPVSSFMDQFCLNFGLKEMSAAQNLREMFISHRHIFNNETYRNLAIGILAHIGTNMLLDKKEFSTWLTCLAQSIVVLEHYNGTDNIDSVFNLRLVCSKNRDLSTALVAIKRDSLKFFRKRATCKCLKRMHLEARKSTPKLGICYNCDKEMDRMSLFVCGRCTIDHYCSRGCQVAAWPYHKSDCDNYAKANRTRGE